MLGGGGALAALAADAVAALEVEQSLFTAEQKLAVTVRCAQTVGSCWCRCLPHLCRDVLLVHA
jgi:hypothetical protein